MITTEWKRMRLFPIPSIIYLIHYNIQFAMLTYVDTSTYQIMGNLKIVTTAILFRLFSRKLSNLQWMEIVLLVVGTTTSQVKGCGEASCDYIYSTYSRVYFGDSFCLYISICRCLYRVLMKRNSDSLYWQNVQLYKFISHQWQCYTMVLSVYLFNFKPTVQIWYGRMMEGNMELWLPDTVCWFSHSLRKPDLGFISFIWILEFQMTSASGSRLK